MALKTITRNHGDPMECPTCDAPGNYIDSSCKDSGDFENPVWLYNGDWLCFQCAFK